MDYLELADNAATSSWNATQKLTYWSLTQHRTANLKINSLSAKLCPAFPQLSSSSNIPKLSINPPLHLIIFSKVPPYHHLAFLNHLQPPFHNPPITQCHTSVGRQLCWPLDLRKLQRCLKVTKMKSQNSLTSTSPALMMHSS